MAVVKDLIKVEKAILDAIGELAGAASDVVVGALKGAAEVVHNVIDTVAGDDDEE